MIPLPSYASGSCYLIRPSPTAERIDGATVQLRYCRSGGAIEIALTDYFTKTELPPFADYLREDAMAALTTFAQRNSIDLAEWNIKVSDFAYHPVDNKSRTMRLAIYNALTSAFAIWKTLKIDLPQSLQEGIS